jgi:hypothetical protein
MFLLTTSFKCLNVRSVIIIKKKKYEDHSLEYFVLENLYCMGAGIKYCQLYSLVATKSSLSYTPVTNFTDVKIFQIYTCNRNREFFIDIIIPPYHYMFRPSSGEYNTSFFILNIVEKALATTMDPLFTSFVS